MALVRMYLKSTDKLSDEVLQIIKDNRPEDITFDEDCPELSDDELAKFKRVYPKEELVNN